MSLSLDWGGLGLSRNCSRNCFLLLRSGASPLTTRWRSKVTPNVPSGLTSLLDLAVPSRTIGASHTFTVISVLYRSGHGLYLEADGPSITGQDVKCWLYVFIDEGMRANCPWRGGPGPIALVGRHSTRNGNELNINRNKENVQSTRIMYFIATIYVTTLHRHLTQFLHWDLRLIILSSGGHWDYIEVFYVCRWISIYNNCYCYLDRPPPSSRKWGCLIISVTVATFLNIF